MRNVLGWGLLSAISLAPAAGFAGAWPRGQGNAFVSFAQEQTAPRETAGFEFSSEGTGETMVVFNGLYAELGVTERLTFGIDIGVNETFHTRQTISFLSYTLTDPAHTVQFALSAGLGDREFEDMRYDTSLPVELRFGGLEPVVRTGASLGTGFNIFGRGGWSALDLTQEYRTKFQEYVFKADVTVGITAKTGELIFVQTQYGKFPRARDKIRVVPTYVKNPWPETVPFVWAETAVIVDTRGSDEVGVRFGVWLEF